MPLEVRELIIRLTIEEDNSHNLPQRLSGQELTDLKRVIIEECLDRLNEQRFLEKDR